VRDLYEPHQGAQVMALGLTGLGFIAMATPLAGGAIASALGWRWAIAGVGAFGAALALFIALAWPETLARRNPQTTRLAPMLATWARVAVHPRFVAWAALVACSYGGLFVILAGSSFVFIGVLGLSPAGYGVALASSSAAYILGTLQCRRWIARHGLAGTVRRAGVLTLAGVLASLACSLLARPPLWLVLPPIWLYMFGHGSHQPCGQAGAVGPFPREAGAASALAGFVLAALAFAVGLWLGHALHGGVAPFLRGIAFFGALSVLLAWTLVPRAER
jgi:MFS transporter, DHA1 family, multidrug resistance protein